MKTNVYAKLIFALLSVSLGSCVSSNAEKLSDVPVAEEKVDARAEALDRLEQFHFTEAKSLSAIGEISGMDLSTEQAVVDFKNAKKNKKTLHALFLVVDRDNQLVFFSHETKHTGKITEAEKSRMIQEKLTAIRDSKQSASYGIVLFNDAKI